MPTARFAARLDGPGPKRLLAIDGGGIRGLIALEFLAAIEDTLRVREHGGPSWVLADYFDYIAGTSTGAIIAAGLSLGMSVAQIRGFYLDQGRAMFGRARLVNRLRYRFEGEPLADALRAVFGRDRTLGSPDLLTLLLLVMRNATTDSPWPVSNNPRAKYNNRALPDCNLLLPLWQLVRASTAAPTFFPPEVVDVGPSRFVFEDGAITTYNNPAFLLFLMATGAPYRLCWPTGPERLLLVSVGTGTMPRIRRGLVPKHMNLLYNIVTVPEALMYSTLNQQDLLCRAFGACLHGPLLDAEIGDLLAAHGGSGLPALYTYVRYNAELTREGLDAIGLAAVRPEHVQRMDDTRHMDTIAAVGRAAAAAQVDPAHFVTPPYVA